MALALLISLLAGATIVLGGLVVRLSRGAARIEHFSIALAAGSMLALLVFDLGPEVLEGCGEGAYVQVVVGLVVGFLGLVALDGAIPDHDAGGAHDAHGEHGAVAARDADAAITSTAAVAGDVTPADSAHDHAHVHDYAHVHDHAPSPANAVHIGIISAVAIILHNIIEGMAVYSVALSAPADGALYAFAIALHNIPVGMLLFSTLEKSRPTTRRVAVAAVTFSTFAGGVAMAALSHAVPEEVMVFFVAAAAGMICYILVMELAGRLVRSRPVWVSVAGCVAGFLIVVVASQFG